jgi:hypothetical protein
MLVKLTPRLSLAICKYLEKQVLLAFSLSAILLFGKFVSTKGEMLFKPLIVVNFSTLVIHYWFYDI